MDHLSTITITENVYAGCDVGLIAEVILYSEGFESSKILAKKMVQMYKLCSEQLSQQDHYDFGMRYVVVKFTLCADMNSKFTLHINFSGL